MKMKKKRVLIAIGAAVLALIGILSVASFQRGQNERDEPLDNEPLENETNQDPPTDGDLDINIPPISESKEVEKEKPDLDVSTMERPTAPGVSDVTVEYDTKESPGDSDAE
jgi:hypothetical protein